MKEQDLRIVWEGNGMRVTVAEGQHFRVFHVFKQQVDDFGAKYWIQTSIHINKSALPKKYHWVSDLMEAMFPPHPESEQDV